MNKFQLDERLQADCFEVVELENCQVLLLDNRQIPWLILVPKVIGATELTDLPIEQQQAILTEINQASSIISKLFNPEKLNIAAIGNVVSQLHIHVIGRYHSDPVWPSPVWGNLNDDPYHEQELQKRMTLLKQAFSESD
jgi:diadenosine tetraphosphate (Ap4A) HIT family hydrolase